jgi:hypothetical protein
MVDGFSINQVDTLDMTTGNKILGNFVRLTDTRREVKINSRR